MTIYQTYLKSIQDIYINKDEVTELSFRTPFENLLRSFVDDNGYKLSVIQEAKKQKEGKPDFKIKNKIGVTIGYVETKLIGEDLDDTIKSEQLAKYYTLS